MGTIQSILRWFRYYQRLLIWGGGTLLALILLNTALKKDTNSVIAKNVPHVFATQASAVEEMIFVRSSGITAASRKLNLLSETAGQIYHLHHRKGEVLGSGDSIATIYLDDRNQQLKEAKAAHALAKEKLEITKKLAAGNYRSSINLKTDQVEYEAAAAKLARIEKEIENTRITAPFKGVLGDVFLEEGSVVTPGTPIASLLEMDPLVVQVYVSEQNHGRFKLGSETRVTFSSRKTTMGKVRFISSIADPKTHMFLVEVSLSNPDFSIPEGVTAQVDIPTQAAKVHKISPSVLSLDSDGHMIVKTIDKDHRVQIFRVQIVQSIGNVLWVVGLPEESIIIDYGGHFVNAGDEVTWTPTEQLKGAKHE